MIKYVATAVSLKCFSSHAMMRSVYRRLGNRFGGKRRSHGPMPAYYIRRIKRMLDLVQKFGIVGDGGKILELGTGWLHWEALTLALFFDIEAVLYDVWDNRQFGGLKNYVRQLREQLATGAIDAVPSQLIRAQSVIDKILQTQSFEELYSLLSFSYIVESSGSLKAFPNESFDLVVSAGVLEHVYRAAVPTLIAETNRVLKPGAWAVHSIDTSDHLSHYDTSASPKRYLIYSEAVWKRFFENDVQYINRMQRCDWLELFGRNGFQLLEEDASKTDIGNLRIAPPYARFDRRDLETTSLRLTFRKSKSL